MQAVREGRVPGMAVAEPPPAVALAGAGAGGRLCLPASGALFIHVHLCLRKPDCFEACNTCYILVSLIRGFKKVHPRHMKVCPWHRVAPAGRHIGRTIEAVQVCSDKRRPESCTQSYASAQTPARLALPGQQLPRQLAHRCVHVISSELATRPACQA